MPDSGSIVELTGNHLTFAVYFLILLNVVQTTIGIIMWRVQNKMKDGVVWVDRFEEFKESIVDRVESLERVRNGT